MAAFLRAAASVIADLGYERATMSAIAHRAHSSIGSLYQFFSNKRSVAEALRTQYMEEIEQYWVALAGQAAALSAEELARRLVTLQLEIIKKYPALLALLELPSSARTSKQRELIRTRIATVLLARAPGMARPTALRTASVVQQVSRGLLVLYGQSDAGHKAGIIEEFTSVLIGYLVPKLSLDSAPSSRAPRR